MKSKTMESAKAEKSFKNQNKIIQKLVIQQK